VQADAFVWLERNRERRFDLVVLDPPSLAPSGGGTFRGYPSVWSLATNGLRALRPGGILVAASCSAHVSRVEFYEAIQLAARKVNRPFSEIERTGHPADHPVAFAEAEYLKCIICG
jgi:23S rRNA (cytosine1962-C5)-methyltransferase